eukprot:g2057.t1
MWGTSRLRKLSVMRETSAVNDTIATVLQRTPLKPDQFGEGIALWNDNLVVQLTYHSGIFNIYDKSSMKQVGQVPYPPNSFQKEAWGMDSDVTASTLYVSDGTNAVYVLESSGSSDDDIQNLKVRDTLHIVRNDGVPVDGLNDLAFDRARDSLWGVVDSTPCAVEIDPRSGEIRGWLDLSSIHPFDEIASYFTDVGTMNGISTNAERRTMFVTGKNWEHIFEIEIVPDASRSMPPVPRACERKKPPAAHPFLDPVSSLAMSPWSPGGTARSLDSGSAKKFLMSLLE